MIAIRSASIPPGQSKHSPVNEFELECTDVHAHAFGIFFQAKTASYFLGCLRGRGGAPSLDGGRALASGPTRTIPLGHSNQIPNYSARRIVPALLSTLP